MTRGVMRRRGVARDKPRQAGLRSGGGTGVVCGIAVCRFAALHHDKNGSHQRGVCSNNQTKVEHSEGSSCQCVAGSGKEAAEAAAPGLPRSLHHQFVNDHPKSYRGMP